MTGEERENEVSNVLMEDVEVYTFLAQTCYWGQKQEKFSQGTEASCRAKLVQGELCQLKKGTRGN